MRLYSYNDLEQAELTVSRMGNKLTVSVFLIDGLLIDTGPFRKKEELSALFEQRNIEQVILTHHHEDHTGMAHWFNQAQIPVSMHALGLEECREKVRLPLYRRVFWGERKPFNAEPAGNYVTTEHFHWEIIHTPGHAHDHISLYNREKGWMIGGDLYVSPKPKSLYRFESVPQLIQSLRKLAAYDFDVLIDSHAGILFDGKAKVKAKLQYLLQMQQEVLFMHNKGIDVKEIRKQLFPKKHPMHYISFYENSPLHFIRSVVSGN